MREDYYKFQARSHVTGIEMTKKLCKKEGSVDY